MGWLRGAGGCIPANLRWRSSASKPLSPPADGPYKGIVLFQDRDANALVNVAHFASNASYDVSGLIYAANARVQITRKQGDIGVGTQFLSRTLFLTGTGTLNVTGNAAKSRLFGLVE